MLKHLFFVLISVLALCAPVTVYAEEAPTGENYKFFGDIVVVVKAGDSEFTYFYGNPFTKEKVISVAYGETTIGDIANQLTPLNQEKFRKVGLEVDGEEGWYFWDSFSSGWRDEHRTTMKSSDTFTAELIGKNSYLKGIGTVYEYLGDAKIKVVNEEGVELFEIDLTKGVDPYTAENPCWHYERYKDGEWVICKNYEFDWKLQGIFNPYETGENLDNYRIKVFAHDMDEEHLVCKNCHKHIVTKASDFDTLWELYETDNLESDEISIESDIDLSDYTPTHALLPFVYYTGMTIDGHGHTISNFKGNYPFASDYCTYDNQTIKNLTIDNFDITLSISDGLCDTKEGENDDVYVLIMGDNNDISNCTFTGKVAIEGEEGKNYIPCLGYEYLNLSNTTVSINGKVEISTGIAEVEADGSIYVRGREIIATEDVRIYNLMGEDVTRLNGMLNKGVYIVKGSKATKVVVR